MPFRRICNYWIVVYLLHTVVNTVPSNWKITYFVYMLNDYGYSSISFGIFMFLSAICEVPALIISKKVIAGTVLLAGILIGLFVLKKKLPEGV